MKRFLFLILLVGGVYAGTTFMVPMRDGIRLATDVYLPPDTSYGPVPLVLNRTPYGRNPGGAFRDSLFAHGIGWVCQDIRGCGDSEGRDSIFWDDGWGEKQDGYDTVEWLASQPWCNGKIGVYGGSAHGITSYLCAGALPPHLVCGFVAHCASNLYKHAAFPGGCYRREQIDNWYKLRGAGYMLDFIAEHYIYDSTWYSLNLERRFEMMDIPFYHVAGWYDTFCEGNIDAFVGLQRNNNQKLIIGPWTHGGWRERKQGDLFYPENSLWDDIPPAVQWFAHYLKGEDNGIDRESPVHCYIMGDCTNPQAPGNEWFDFDSWPPENITYDTLFLHPDQTLKPYPPSTDTGITYYHDPGGPLLNNGGRNLIIPAGPKNQFFQDIAKQGKIWTSDVLAQPLIIAGRVRARIYLSSDCVDTDVMVRLCDLYPDNKSYLVMDGALMARFREGTDHEVFMSPGEVYGMDVDLGNIGIAFAEGHRIRVGVSSALFPRYEANPNTGEPFRKNTHTQVAHNTIHMGEGYPSCIILPVLKGLSIEEVVSKERFSIFPNPFHSYCSIQAPKGARVEVFDIKGCRVAELPSGRYVWKPSEELPSGVYFLKIKRELRKVVYQR